MMVNRLSALSRPELEDGCECVHPRAVAAARRLLGSGPEANHLAAIFGILADPTRVRVLTALRAGELCVTDLAAATGINRTTVSHQLRVLRTHRLVRRRRAGKTVFYAIDDGHVDALLDMAAVHVSEAEGQASEERSA